MIAGLRPGVNQAGDKLNQTNEMERIAMKAMSVGSELVVSWARGRRGGRAGGGRPVACKRSCWGWRAALARALCAVVLAGWVAGGDRASGYDITLDLDSTLAGCAIDASVGSFGGAGLTQYFADYGITVSSGDGTPLIFPSTLNVGSAQYLITTQPNFFSLATFGYDQQMVTMRLTFDQPVQRIQFIRAGFQSSGGEILMPSYTVTPIRIPDAAPEIDLSPSLGSGTFGLASAPASALPDVIGDSVVGATGSTDPLYPTDSFDAVEITVDRGKVVGSVGGDVIRDSSFEFIGIDDLQIDYAEPIPEPSTLWLLAIAGLWSLVGGRRGRRGIRGNP